MTEPAARDDALTIAAIGVLACCIVTADHEAIGHGSVCLMSGGHITQLTSVYFYCEPGTAWIAAGGPIGNLIGGALAWLVAQYVPVRAARLRLLLLLVAAFALFWEGGYLFKAMLTLDGDSAIAARAAFGEPSTAWRIGGAALGVLLYFLGMRATTASLRRLHAANARAGLLLRLPWLAASVAACAAALAYAPDRLEAVHQAALEIGAASIPLLLLPRGMRLSPAGSEVVVARSFGWIAFAIVVFAAFVLTLGKGLP